MKKFRFLLSIVVLIMLMILAPTPGTDNPAPVQAQSEFERSPWPWEIWVMNPDGSGLTNLTNNSTNDFQPAWSPDGSRIAFVCVNGTGNICIMNADGSGLVRHSVAGSDPTWSPDGTHLAFEAWDEYSLGIAVMYADGSDLIYSAINSISPGPDWSPDGTRIVYQSAADLHWKIYVMNADGSEKTRLTTDFGVGPTWSPDGWRIAFRDGESEISIMNPDGSELMRLTYSDNLPTDNTIYGMFGPEWSPDGTRLMYGCYGEICVINADGSEQTRLTNNRETAPAYNAVWSPDGNRIVFECGYNDICVINADGSSLINLTNSNRYEYKNPTWSPDGRFIAFESDRIAAPPPVTKAPPTPTPTSKPPAVPVTEVPAPAPPTPPPPPPREFPWVRIIKGLIGGGILGGLYLLRRTIKEGLRQLFKEKPRPGYRRKEERKIPGIQEGELEKRIEFEELPRPEYRRKEKPSIPGVPEEELEKWIIIEKELPYKVPKKGDGEEGDGDGDGEHVRPIIWFECPPLQCAMPCECFKILVWYKDGPGGRGLNLNTLEIRPAQPLGGGLARGGVDRWTNIVGFFEVFPNHAIIKCVRNRDQAVLPCVPHRLWFPCGRNGLMAKIANLDGEWAEAEHIFRVRPRRLPIFFG